MYWVFRVLLEVSVPAPEIIDHVKAAAFVAEPFTFTEAVPKHTFKSGPAEMVGTGVYVMVKLSDTGLQVPCVTVRVKVIVPPVMSEGAAVYEAFRVVLKGLKVPLPVVDQAPPAALVMVGDKFN